MKALVTGGGGFLGRAIVEQLISRGHRVSSFSRQEYPELAALGVRLIQGDLADETAVRKAVAGHEIVFHVAAKAGIWGPYEEYYRANVLGTRNVLDACRSRDVSRLVYTSSPSVVFNGQDMEGVDESVPYPDHFKAAYPETKARAERLVLAANGGTLATVALRPHLIWGPRDTHLVPGIIKRGRSGNLYQVGDGLNKVDVTYVEDAARAHLLAADRLAPGSTLSGHAYFISQDQPVALFAFINRILDAAGLPPVQKRVPFSVAYPLGWVFEKAYTWLPLRGEPRLTRFLVEEMATSHWFDLSAAKRDLSYEPRVTLAEGFKRLRCWLEKTPVA